jgi:hypothetical protein
MQPGFEKTLPPKKLPEDGNRYIFPTGTPAPGSEFAPSEQAPQTPQGFVANPEVAQALQGAAMESAASASQPDVVTRQPIERSMAGAPQAQGYGSAPESLIMSGLKQGQDAASQSIAATDALMSSFEQNEAARKQREETALAEVRKKIEDTDKEVANFKWDNKSVWEKSSTGQKVALAIGGFLSSLSEKSADAFQGAIESSLQQDLQQQKESYKALKEKGSAAQSYYGQLLNKFGSEQAADAAMMGAKMQMIQNKLKVTADTAQSKLVAANALKGIELTDAQLGKYKAEAAKLATEQQANGIPGFSGQVKDPAALRELQTRVAAKASAENQIKSLEGLLEQGAKAPLTTNKKLAEQTRDALAADLAKAMFGRSSDAELEIAKNLIPDVTSFMQPKAIDKKLLQNLKTKLNTDVGSYAKAVGLTPVGANIGKLK